MDDGVIQAPEGPGESDSRRGLRATLEKIANRRPNHGDAAAAFYRSRQDARAAIAALSERSAANAAPSVAWRSPRALLRRVLAYGTAGPSRGLLADIEAYLAEGPGEPSEHVILRLSLEDVRWLHWQIGRLTPTEVSRETYRALGAALRGQEGER
jgi:hypothetical protein